MIEVRWSSVPVLFRWGAGRFNRWIREHQPVTEMELGSSAQFWGDPKWSLICCFVLLGTLLMPPEGLGIRLCLFYQVSGLDCPGCGMTRGISHLWRGHFLRSVHLHFFAPIVFLFLVVQASSLFIPNPYKTKILYWIDRHDRVFRYLWVIGGTSFFLYGGFRIAYELFRKGVFGEI